MWNEEELIEAIARGEEFALEILFEKHYTSLWKYTLVILKNPEDAEEVINETFFRAFRHVKNFEGKGAFGAWLFRIARNLSIDYLNKRNNRMELISIDEIIEKKLDEPENIIEKIETLKAEYREVILLKDIAGYTMEDISQIMNITVSGAKTLHHRAIKKLRERFKEGVEK